MSRKFTTLRALRGGDISNGMAAAAESSFGLEPVIRLVLTVPGAPGPIPISGRPQLAYQEPPARFIQFRAEWIAGSDARINTISIPYLAQNSSPSVRSITVSSMVGANAAKTGTGNSQQFRVFRRLLHHRD